MIMKIFRISNKKISERIAKPKITRAACIKYNIVKQKSFLNNFKQNVNTDSNDI